MQLRHGYINKLHKLIYFYAVDILRRTQQTSCGWFSSAIRTLLMRECLRRVLYLKLSFFIVLFLFAFTLLYCREMLIQNCASAYYGVRVHCACANVTKNLDFLCKMHKIAIAMAILTLYSDWLRPKKCLFITVDVLVPFVQSLQTKTRSKFILCHSLQNTWNFCCWRQQKVFVFLIFLIYF